MTPYIPIRELVEYRKGNAKVIMLIKLYLDESGDHDKPYVCMCGGIASVEDWQKFECDWADVLEDYGATELHTAQLLAYKPREQYQGWSEKRRQCLMADLVPIILRTVKAYVGSHESVEQYKQDPTLQDKPYYHCMFSCLDGAVKYAGKMGPQEKVEVIFADHPEHGKIVRRVYPEVQNLGGMYARLAGDSYKKPRDVLQLQAADFIAWLYRKSVEPLDEKVNNPTAKAIFDNWYPKLREQPWIDNGQIPDFKV